MPCTGIEALVSMKGSGNGDEEAPDDSSAIARNDGNASEVQGQTDSARENGRVTENTPLLKGTEKS